MRVLYVAVGLALVAVPVLLGVQGGARWALPILGGLAIITGATGW
jgi:hypothetical protein